MFPGPARNGPATESLPKSRAATRKPEMVLGAARNGGVMARESAPILLVPGFWLGAWAWDEVAAFLRESGHEVRALTLPGLDSVDTDRSEIHLTDHVDAICDAVQAASTPVVLAVHSGAGFSGYAASDRIPDKIAAMVYVDSAPGVSPMDPTFEGVEKPLEWKEIEAEENLDGLTEAQLERFRRLAVPQPGHVLRDRVPLTNGARLDVPTTIICTAYTSQAYKKYAFEHEMSWLAGIRELKRIDWIDLPTSHWPMWSRPEDLARILGDIASAHSRP